MSAAATAAGYLYASGRLRGRAAKEEGHGRDEAAPRRRVRVAALPESVPAANDAPAAEPARPKRAPTVQYRTRRWRPDAA
jgi:hypothetical protein